MHEVTCPHCDSPLEMFNCAKCKTPTVHDPGYSGPCGMCELEFCTDHLDDHDCTEEEDAEPTVDEDED